MNTRTLTRVGALALAAPLAAVALGTGAGPAAASVGLLQQTTSCGSLPEAVAVYPPASSDDGRIDDSSPRTGQTVTVTAGPFTPGTRARGCVVGPRTLDLGTALVGADGLARWTFEIPADWPRGSYAVRVVGLRGGALVTVDVPFALALSGTSTGAGTGSGADGSATGASGGLLRDVLPNTGTDVVIPAALLGVALLGSGTVVHRLGRRRSAARTS